MWSDPAAERKRCSSACAALGLERREAVAIKQCRVKRERFRQPERRRFQAETGNPGFLRSQKQGCALSHERCRPERLLSRKHDRGRGADMDVAQCACEFGLAARHQFTAHDFSGEQEFDGLREAGFAFAVGAPRRQQGRSVD